MKNLTEYQETLSMSHAVFKQLSPTRYRVDKDVFRHIAEGSVISVQMVECYKKIVPSSARVSVIYLEETK